MRLRGVKTAALNKVRLFRNQLIDVHSGVTLKKMEKSTFIFILCLIRPAQRWLKNFPQSFLTRSYFPSEKRNAGVGVVERNKSGGGDVQTSGSYWAGGQGVSGEQVESSFTLAEGGQKESTVRFSLE